MSRAEAWLAAPMPTASVTSTVPPPPGSSGMLATICAHV